MQERAFLGAVEQEGAAASFDATMHAWCLRELTYWAATRPEPETVFATLADLNRHRRTLFLLQIDDTQVRIRDKPDFFTRVELDNLASNDGTLGRAQQYRSHIQASLERAGGGVHTIIAMDANDMPLVRADVPVFGFQKKWGDRAILLPDIDFLRSDNYSAKRFIDPIPYKHKKVSAVFVGGTTGGGTITAKAVKDSAVPRIRSALRFKGSERVFFTLPKICAVDKPETAEMIRAMDVSGPPLTLLDQYSHRFLISMDGHGATCQRVALALRSQAVLLKYESPHRLFYFDRLVPWQHYIPIFTDDDVERVVRLEEETPGTFASIAQESISFADTYLSSEALHTYTASILRGYAALFPLQKSAVRPSVADRAAGPAGALEGCDVLAHIRNTGDVWFASEAWNGRVGSGMYIEGLTVYPHDREVAESVRYRTLAANGEWSEQRAAGQFCGTRGKDHPVLGFEITLEGAARDRFHGACTVRTTNGVVIGPTPFGQVCVADPPAPIEALQISINRALE